MDITEFFYIFAILSNIVQIMTQDRKTLDFIFRARKIHGDDYDYSQTRFKNLHTKICIICKEHGEFWQLPISHLRGGGCPLCNESHLEKKIRQFLNLHKIKFSSQHTFDWLKHKNNLSLDFYLPDYNIAIECQGRQHFESINVFGGEEEFKLIQDRDNTKKQLCEDHGIKVLYFADKKYEENIIIDENVLLEEIKQCKHRC